MGLTIRRVNYFYVTVDDRHGTGYWLLEHLRQQSVSLVAFTAFPRGGGKTQLDLVPDEIEKLQRAVKQAGVELVGPKRAFLAQGKDDAGAIVDLHAKLASTDINVYAANGVSAGNGHFGYLFWVKPDDYEEAAVALGV